MSTSVSARGLAEEWRLWGGSAFLAVDAAGLLSAARRVADQVIAGVDASCSRFRSDSGLSHANRHPGRWVEADPLLVAATRVAVAAAAETDGLVDPCLGRTMVSLGYDADIGELAVRPSPPGLPLTPVRPDAWREIEVADDAIRVPEGVQLDLGATAKAWAADLVADTLVGTLECAVVVSLGGDVRVLGPEDRPPAGWPVRVAEHPDDVGSGLRVLVRGGLATSSTVVRRWQTRAGVRHHLVDPRTGAPVREAFRTVTAVGHTCVAANVATTAALVLGDEAPGWLSARGVGARLVSAEGSVLTVNDWPDDPIPTPSEEAL
jgi:FAD:protein FMN transferase